MSHAWLYDLLYRWGAPWEVGPRSELVELVETGRLSAERLAPGRAIDLGCGSGANSVFLAQHGFDVVGVDFSTVALRKAEKMAQAAGVPDSTTFLWGDLTADSLPGAEGPFDLLVDYGTLDDLAPAGRRAMAANIARLARPGANFLLWAFHAAREDLPWLSRSVPSRPMRVMAPGEEVELFGEAFTIERLPRPEPESHQACFLMTRRAEP